MIASLFSSHSVRACPRGVGSRHRASDGSYLRTVFTQLVLPLFLDIFPPYSNAFKVSFFGCSGIKLYLGPLFPNRLGFRSGFWVPRYLSELFQILAKCPMSQSFCNFWGTFRGVSLLRLREPHTYRVTILLICHLNLAHRSGCWDIWKTKLNFELCEICRLWVYGWRAYP